MRVFIGHVRSQLEASTRDSVFKVYVSDCLRIITENTAKYAGGSFMKMRYSDLIESKPKQEKSAEEIIDDVVKKAGLEVI